MKTKLQLAILSDDTVVNKIYAIRNQKVMLDSDLAELYGVETRVLNQAVKRNTDRFPEDFMFQLNETEWSFLISQFVMSKTSFNKDGRGGRRNLPFVFTEHGVLMLSSVLNSAQAIAVNIQIVRVFTKMRKLLNEQQELRMEMDEIKKKLSNQDKNIELVFSYIDELTEKKVKPRKRIGFKPDEL